MSIEIKVLKLHMFDLLHLFEYFKPFLINFCSCPNNMSKMSENFVDIIVSDRTVWHSDSVFYKAKPQQLGIKIWQMAWGFLALK